MTAALEVASEVQSNLSFMTYRDPALCLTPIFCFLLLAHLLYLGHFVCFCIPSTGADDGH